MSQLILSLIGGLLKFLLNQKRAIEYYLSDLPASGSLGSQAGQQSVHCADAVAEDLKENKQQPFESKSSSFHNSASHGTDECQLYLSKTRGERMDMLIEKAACWSCLKIEHRLRDCRSGKACGENGCTTTHHRTLQEENREASVSVTASSCGDPLSDTCLLLLQRVRTGKGWANVMWDNVAALSFITNSKAKAEMLNGARVEISIVRSRLLGASISHISPRSQPFPTKNYL